MCDQILSEDERGARQDGPVSFVDELVVALTNARIYDRKHPRLATAVETLGQGLASLCRETESDTVRLGAADGFLFFRNRPLLGASLAARRLTRTLEEVEAGGLAFQRKATQEELFAFVHFVARSSKGVESPKQANAALSQAGCLHVEFLPPYEEATGTWGETSSDSRSAEFEDAPEASSEQRIEMDMPSRVYQDVVSSLQDSMVRSCSGDNLDITTMQARAESILKQLKDDTSAMMRLARYERYDAFTFGHSIRVCFVALNFARHLTDDTQLVERIGLAALMHDIGKAWVPFEVLHSTDRLSDAERAEMNMHPVHGGQILLGNENPDPLAVAVAFSHHRNMNGSGYPNAIHPGSLSTPTMIVKLADVYEALTAARPYKPRMSPTRAYRIMMDMGDHFEPSMLRRFIEVNGFYPVGSRVKLTTGEVARVTAQTDHMARPHVVTELAASGEQLFREDVAALDLRQAEAKDAPAVADIILDEVA